MSAAVAASRRTLAWLLGSVAALCVVVAALAPITIGGDRALLALPTIVHGGLVLGTVTVMLAMRTGLRVDALTLFTAWELLRGCVAPVILMLVGPATSGFYYRLGTWGDARFVLLLGNLFFAVVVTVRVVIALLGQHRATSRATNKTNHTNQTNQTDRLDAPTGLTTGGMPAWPLIALGLVGLVLRFPSVSAVTGFLSGNVDALQSNDVIGASGLLLASLYLRPLLVIGLVIVIWQRHSRGLRWWPIVPVLLVAAVFALASYGLNRGTVAYAVIAIVLVFFERSTRTIRLAPTVTAIGVFGGFFVAVGSLRSSLWTSRTGLDASPLDLTSVLQSVLGYAGSPLQLSAILPTVEQSSPFGVRSFALSLLSPIPGAPDISRTQSGMALYNNIAYHSFVGKDQLLPTWFEGWLSFGILGLVAVAVVVGVLLAGSDALRLRMRTPLGLYGATIFAIWVTQAGVTGTSVIEQNALNFVLTPILLAAAGRLLRAAERTRTAPPEPNQHTQTARPNPIRTTRKAHS